MLFNSSRSSLILLRSRLAQVTGSICKFSSFKSLGLALLSPPLDSLNQVACNLPFNPSICLWKRTFDILIALFLAHRQQPVPWPIKALVATNQPINQSKLPNRKKPPVNRVQYHRLHHRPHHLPRKRKRSASRASHPTNTKHPNISATMNILSTIWFPKWRKVETRNLVLSSAE